MITFDNLGLITSMKPLVIKRTPFIQTGFQVEDTTIPQQRQNSTRQKILQPLVAWHQSGRTRLLLRGWSVLIYLGILNSSNRETFKNTIRRKNKYHSLQSYIIIINFENLYRDSNFLKKWFKWNWCQKNIYKSFTIWAFHILKGISH